MTQKSAYALAPVSFGELLDKISILEIKQQNISDPARLAQVERELALLSEVRKTSDLDETRLAPLYDMLKAVNQELWTIEDDIRDHEANKTFDDNFISLARSVYKTNDRRFSLKNEINIITSSTISEQKSYHDY